MFKKLFHKLFSDESPFPFILFLFILPVASIYFGIVPVEYRIVALMVISLFIFGYIRRSGWGADELGFHPSSWKAGILPYSLFTIVGVAVTVWVGKSYFPVPEIPWWQDTRLISLFVLISFAQEFVFRGFLMKFLAEFWKSPYKIIITNAILFALIHVIYQSPEIGVPLAFVGGIFFSGIYYFFPNIVYVSVVHSILNFLAVYYGIFGAVIN